MKTKTITQTGIKITGQAMIELWGDKGIICWIDMQPTIILNEMISKTAILNAVNDGGFGCKAILEANIEIYIIYDNGSEEWDRELTVDHPIHTSQFLKRGI